MRVMCFLFLAVFVGIVVLFAWQNQDTVTLTLFDWRLQASMAAVLGATYALGGMFSGWSVVGLLRRSFRRLTAADERHEAAARS
jgi:uncharacterized integral membrane protein